LYRTCSRPQGIVIKPLRELPPIDAALKVYVYMLGQDDPSKCTAAKLTRFGLAERIRHVRHNMLLLNPLSREILSRKEAISYGSVCAIDCSWEKAGEVLSRYRESRYGRHRRLPALLAANPTNYSKLGKLSTAEALAGCLFILGYENQAVQLLNKFKWGPTFLKLNGELLRDYLNADSSRAIMETERQYFGQLY
jgi:pre-rRNA-processing protein TSR3